MSTRTPVSHTTLLSTLGTGLAIVLGLSSSCDKAIEQRMTSIRQLSISEHNALSDRVDALERWHEREENE